MIDSPPRPPYEIARLEDIALTETGAHPLLRLALQWRQVRHHFMIREFSVNAFTSTARDQEIVHEHFEQPNDATDDVGDEELYLVLGGSATVRLNDETVPVEPGTFVFVGDPSVVRSITAHEPGTTVLAFGTNPGVRFVVSKFEQDVSPPERWS
jgi:mannose-6-phosphate isomerase-like protein (cupin superfamily)